MPPPEIDHRVVKDILAMELPRARGRRLALVHARYAPWAPARFSIQVDDVSRSVEVRDEQSVLGIVDAWHAHRHQDGDGILVVTTGAPDGALGWDLLGHAIGRRTLTVEPDEIVKHRFGARELDPRVRRPWLLDALLAAEPAGGWPRSGVVLTRDAAVRAVLAERVGIDSDALDAGSLLDWSQTRTGPARFTELPADQQDGLRSWLEETVGGVAAVLLALVARGRAEEAMAVGLVASVLDQPQLPAEAALAVGGLLGNLAVRPDQRRDFVAAIEGTLERWAAAAENGGAAGDAARLRLLDVVERADALASGAGLTEQLADNRFLPSSLRARLRAVAAILSAEPDETAIVTAAGALTRLRDHRLARLYPQHCAAAEMAVRLLRWLATPAAPITSVAGGVDEHLRTGGWVERALTAVWAGEPEVDTVVARGYAEVYDAAQARRQREDEEFAAVLASWAAHATAAAPGGALLIEQVLDEIAVPLLAVGPPLVVVVDGMSAAVAVELGQQLVGRPWVEVSREPGRRAAAVATIPSVTRASRASLLTGRLCTADQKGEADGFRAFWQRHRRRAVLVHKARIAGAAGRRLADDLVEALAGDVVVGVVLNTVDDALDHGREGDRTSWRPEDITYLPELLDAARSYGRPVVLVADHGHVLERSAGSDAPTPADGVESARWRTGEPGPGEVALRGPRVLCGDGAVVVPWRSDIRYTKRRSGYHGGASPAEMTAPVLTLLPSADNLPLGWTPLAPEATEPDWWNGRPAEAGVVVAPPPRRPARTPQRPHPQMEGLFDAPEPVPVSIGTRVVDSDVYSAQRRFVRKPPDKAVVAALIDSLLAADGTLSATAVAMRVGRAGRDPAALVATLQRLLNVEGYPVLSMDGSGLVRLDGDLLRLQFGLDER
ncbi:BREX-2 system phosphatase PglZ [Pseudonocardia hispaniensis]|uniref:BREX-2 system phosphatase PglZ n=1 Tax=Pseudonocardia hispaniensis TaxID=904933 RepID=A0ABW1IY07_9PSEU